MTDKQLQKKYPQLWKAVYKQVRDEIIMTAHPRKDSLMLVIPYNAAFIACYEHHKMVKK